MAGHSKFKNIQHRKGAQDQKRARLFTKLVKEISVAARLGSIDPHYNPRLKSALMSARALNLPKERIEKALISDDTSKKYEEIRYEGFFHSVGLIVEVLTDNRNRSASEIRSIFNKLGGSLVETGNVGFMFDRVGIIKYDKDTINCSEDELLEIALTIGAQDLDIHNMEFFTLVQTFGDDLDQLVNNFSNKLGNPEDSYIGWKSMTKVLLDQEKIAKLINLIDSLESNDDVQRVFTNALIQ